MSGDYSRRRFDPRVDFTGVHMQQGRVQLDSDWNEQSDILDRRLRAETADLMSAGPNPDIAGVAFYPRLTPDAFRITADSGALTIGRGRMYVDGLLAENHGAGDLEFDRLLSELRGVDDVPYVAQPYHPRPAPLPAQGRGLAYLEVWQREVDYLVRPDLVEIAVGVDTTTRSQTVWQVRFFPGIDLAVDCDTPDVQIAGWPAVIRPSAGRLSTSAIGVAPEDDPCELPPGGGFRGLENQLYRVEIHDGGEVGQATFKWSRDNGTVASGVAEVLSARELRLETLGRDSVLRFSTGDWVEIVDDWRELSGIDGDPRRRHGEIRQIVVDEATQTIAFTPDLPSDLVPSGTGNDTIEARHLRVRRWDQRGKVFRSDGTEFFDLNDDAVSHGVIPVPPANTPILLEAGVQVTFSLSDEDGPGGTFHIGDHWMFAARTANASVEVLEQAPPRGPQHHFARLAVVTLPSSATDCRIAWPPEATGGGGDCGCSVCLSPEELEADPEALQQAVDQIRDSGGTICLGVGTYILRDPVRLEGARSVRIRGQGQSTEIAAQGGAFFVRECTDITIEDLNIVGLGERNEPLIGLTQVPGVRLERLGIRRRGDADAAPAIALSRVVTGFQLRHSSIEAPTGVGQWVEGDPDVYLWLQNTWIEQNAFDSLVRGVDLGGRVMHLGITRIDGNDMRGAREGALILTGATLDQFGVDVMNNTFQALGDAVVAGLSGLRIEANEFLPIKRGAGANGIVLQSGMSGEAIDRCMILGNRIVGLGGAGISIEAQLGSALIKHNIIEATGAGIVFDKKGAVESIAIENNQLQDIAAIENEEGSAPAAIRVFRARYADITGNAIRGVGVGNVQGLSRSGILAVGCETVHVSRNEVAMVGPVGDFVGLAAAVRVLRPFHRVTIDSNVLRREMSEEGVRSSWSAILVGAPAEVDFERIAPGTFTLRVDENRHVFVTRETAATVFTGIEDVAIEGNAVESASGAPAVFVAARGECALTDNRCMQLSQAPGVQVTAMLAIANANRVRGGEPSMVLNVDPERSSVLGNITSTDIQIPGGLQAPWNALNVIA